MPAVGTSHDLWAAARDFDDRLPPLECTPEADAAVRDSLRASGLLLLGEIHGVRENPLLVRELRKRFDIEAVALEWSPELAPLVRGAGLSGDGLAMAGAGDGRVTAGHLAVLGDLGPVALIDEVDLSSPPPGLGPEETDRWFWSQRDAAMARAGLAAPYTSMLVVAGNLHTTLTEQEPGTPMGAVLARARPGVRAIGIRYGSGGYYNFGSHRFGGPGWASNERPLLALEGDDLVLTISRVQEAIVLHP